MTTSKTIADHLNLTLHGKDIPVTGHSQLSVPKSGCIVFAKKYDEQYVDLLNRAEGVTAIVTPEYTGKLVCCHMISDNPRLDYIKALNQFFATPKPKGFIHPSATIEAGATVGHDVYIGAGCYISSLTTIGDNCVLHPNVVLDNKVTLGNNCEIKSGAVLGQEGFGFERDEEGNPLHFPHFGDVMVGDNVFIGSNTTVERATLGSTVIEDDVKIDDLVQIGHNSRIGHGSMVTVGAIVCGGAELQPFSYLAPNSSVKEKVTVGSKAFVGLGAVVLKNVPQETIVAGVPAREITKGK